jgi:hypothetical protein
VVPVVGQAVQLGQVWTKTPQAHADIASISSRFLDNPHARMPVIQSVDDIGLSLRRSPSLFFVINSSCLSSKCTLKTVLDSRAVVPASRFLFPFLFDRIIFLEI